MIFFITLIIFIEIYMFFCINIKFEHLTKLKEAISNNNRESFEIVFRGEVLGIVVSEALSILMYVVYTFSGFIFIALGLFLLKSIVRNISQKLNHIYSFAILLVVEHITVIAAAIYILLKSIKTIPY